MQQSSIEFAPTQDCNLACTYCYVKREDRYMTRNTADLFFEQLDEILKIYNSNQYNIAYFGGEPTLNWPIIEYTLPKFNSDPRCTHVTLISNLLIIDEEKLDYLKNNNIGVSWSFDGLWNDERNRPLVSGESSLPVYLEKWPLIKQLTTTPKVMVGPQSISTMVENLEFFINELEIYNPDFTLVRDDVWSNSDIELFETEIKKVADVHIKHLSTGKYSLGFFHLPLLDLVAGGMYSKRHFSCFAGCRGGAFLPNGVFYPCMRFGSANNFPLYDVNKAERFQDNIDALLNPRFHDPHTFPKCQKCTLYKYCNSGCHYSQLRRGPNGEIYGSPVSSVCKLFHIIYNETFRIFEELKDNKMFQQTITGILQRQFKR